MKAYWDTSALIETIRDADLRRRLKEEGGLTRSHSLAEIFSTLTGGNINLRVSAAQASEMISKLADDLSFFDLAPADVLAALKQAKAKGVRGGRVHDFLHAVAAQKSGVKELLTLDQNDFAGLTENITIRQV
jgi:predicted nucleic acid-binding protein